MYLHARKNRDAKFYRIKNLNTAKYIQKCIWADDVSGRYCVYETDENGKYLFMTDCLGRKLTGKNAQLRTTIKKGAIKFIRSDC